MFDKQELEILPDFEISDTKISDQENFENKTKKWEEKWVEFCKKSSEPTDRKVVPKVTEKVDQSQSCKNIVFKKIISEKLEIFKKNPKIRDFQKNRGFQKSFQKLEIFKKIFPTIRDFQKIVQKFEVFKILRFQEIIQLLEKIKCPPFFQLCPK